MCSPLRHHQFGEKEKDETARGGLQEFCPEFNGRKKREENRREGRRKERKEKETEIEENQQFSG